MGNSSLRCCLACVLPCGALDLIRVVHLNGFVDEMTGSVTAGEILKANPNHVLTKPSSHLGVGGGGDKILILSPDSELKRGSIYFLIPSTSLLPPEIKNRKSSTYHRKNKKKMNMMPSSRSRGSDRNIQVWRPHLESISED